MAKKIPLQNGMFAIVDDEDYERCMKHSWSLRVTGRNKTNKDVRARVRGETISLKHFIKKDKRNLTFKNKNELDFRKHNLLEMNEIQVKYMRKGSATSTSKYKGVYWDKSREKWTSAIMVDGKKHYLGRFDSENKAGKAYNDYVINKLDGNGYINKIGKSNNAEVINMKKRKTGDPRRFIRNEGYRGVSKGSKRYQCSIWTDGEQTHLGMFDTPEEAAKAYDKKAYELYGDKAILNFPEILKE